MPYRFGTASLKQLKSCHTDLRAILETVISHMDITILAGHRDEATQNRLQDEGLSRLRYPLSRHNQTPSMAADIAPYSPLAKGGVDWEDREAFAYMGGLVRGIAVMMKRDGRIKHDLVWGGDWNADGHVRDENFRDLVHFELR
ncbi:MAG: M15 family peptidase [Parvibaculales bacterium]